MGKQVVQDPPSKISALHKFLLDNEYSVPTDLNVFQENINDRKKADALHDFLIKQHISVPESSDDFYNELSTVKKKDSIPFGEDGSPENSAPSPLTSSVPEPNELEQLLQEKQDELPETSKQFSETANADLEAMQQEGISSPPKMQLGEDPKGLLDMVKDRTGQDKAQRLLMQQAEDDLKKAINSAGKLRGDVEADATKTKDYNKLTEGSLSVNEHKVELDAAKKVYVDEALDNGIGKTANALNQTAKTVISQGAANLTKSVAIMADHYFPSWMNGDKDKLTEYATYRWGEAMQNWSEEMFPTNPKFQDNFLASQLPQGAGSLIAIAMGGLGRLGSRAATNTLINQAEKSILKTAIKDYTKNLATGSMLVGATMMGVPEYEAAKKAGVSDEEAFEVFLYNMAIGTTDAIPVSIAFSRLNKLTGGGVSNALKGGLINRLKDVGKQGVEQGVIEATQEITQNFLTNLTAKNYYDEFRSLYEGMASDGAVGFVLGAVLGAGAASVANIQDASVRKKVLDYIKAEETKLEDDLGVKPEQDIKTPEGDLSKKPATDEKPKEQPSATPKEGEPAVGEVKKEEALPVQKREPEVKEEVKEEDVPDNKIKETRSADIRTVRDLADFGTEEGMLSGAVFSSLNKGDILNVGGKEYSVDVRSQAKEAVYYTKDGEKVEYKKSSIRLKGENGKSISGELWEYKNGSGQWVGKGQTRKSDKWGQLSRDIEGDITVDLINENNQFHNPSDSFKKAQEFINNLQSKKQDEAISDTRGPSESARPSTLQEETDKNRELDQKESVATTSTPQEEVVRKISDAIGKEKLDKRAIEKIGQEAGIENKNEIKELGELAVVQKARELAKKDDFEGLVQLYNDQPNLSHRTNESISKQQYSTPAPIAYMMGKYIGADKTNTKQFEPSAGNGMLTIVGDPKSYTVNEIDGVRLKNLETQGFNEILSQDGSQEFARPKQYDAVITNPPFGGTNAVNVEGYKLNELAQIMAVRALDTMKDNGKGAIIIGGNSEFSPEGQLKGRDRIFFNYLFNKYNVDDVIDVSGDLYRKQGASFPIRVILINGRKAEAKGAAPTSEWFGEQAESFDDVKNRIDGFLTQQSNETLQPEELVGGPTDVIRDGGTRKGEQTGSKTDDSVPGAQIQEDGGRGVGGQRDVETSESVRSGDAGNSGTESGRGVDSGSDIVERPVSDEVVGEGRTERQEQQQPGGVEAVPKPRARSDRKIAEGGIGASTVQYKPLSGGKSFDLMSPAGMQQEILDAQTDLENDVGDIDSFVMDRLKYKSKDEMYKALGAEQIDGVALAIRNIERGTGIIIGDQTGVGKGRQAAAIIRYGNMQGLAPIFLTEKPNLFTDLYRDLDGIGYGDIKPFIVNSTGEKFKGVYRGKDVAYKAPSQSDKDHKQMLKIGQIPNDAKVILATYSQFSSPRYEAKINFLQAMAQNNIIILDESHNASGQGNTSSLFQQLLPDTKGVVYLSGTFAKRADNMPVYALKTSMQEANMTTTELITAIEGGGVALQEIISSQLAESGEMVRRERTFKGIEVNNHIIGADNKEVSKRQLQQADQVTSIMNEIIKFQTEHVKPVISSLNKDAIREGERVIGREGTNMAGVDNTPYFSKVFNVINQLLYSIKARDTAQMAVEMLKKGEKPFIAIRSTMEAMLKDIIERGDLKIGDAIEPDFRFVLKKGLEGVMRISVKDAMGNSQKQDISVSTLPIQSQLEYKRIMSKIASSQTGLTISPIDEVVQLIEKAGYKVGEVTGRKTKLDFKGGKGIVNNNKKQPVNELYRKYNSGEIDVLVVNSSGSTGASAHASQDVKDQRQRHMLILEPELNISTLVQILGRINRTGQIKLPKYTFVGSNIPAEQRLMMMTMRKLKSLDANTTSNQKQSKSFLEVPEIFNKYGDQVVVEYLMENPEIIESLGDPLKMLTTGNEVVEPGDTIGAANKVTGRVAILPTSKQAEFYAEITDRYNTTLQFLNDAGLNDLEVRQLPLKAKTISKNLSKMGKGGISRFGEDTFLEEVEADVLKKPMTKSEVDKSITDLGTNTNEELKGQLEAYKESVIADINTVEDERLANKIAKAKEDTSLDEEAKAQLIKELEENAQVTKEYKSNKEADQIKYVDTLFTFFTPGRAVKMPFDFEEMGSSFSASDGIFLGFDINQKKKKPFIRSNVILKFAVNDSRRLISIPSSKNNIINDIRVNSYSLSSDHQEHISNKWDELKKPKARGKRHIVTGNVLQGLSNPDFRKGRIVKYSTDEGFINTGILLSESFDPTKAESSKTVSVPAGKAAKVIIDSPTGSIFQSADNLWEINKRTGSKFSLRVPKSKQTGGKYYLDSKINDLVDNGIWDSVGGQMEAFTDSSRLDELLHLLGTQFSTSFTLDNAQADELAKKAVEFSERSAATYKDVNAAMATFIPIKIQGKVKKDPTNKSLLAHLKKQNLSEAELEQQLNDAIKFDNAEVEKRFQEANSPTDNTNISNITETVKDFFSGFKSHFRYLNERTFPREANILREFEGLKSYTTGQAAIYMKGLVEPLTKQQYRILERKIILSDLLESIESELNMEGVDGKLPFGFENKVEVNKELKKVNELTEADLMIQEAFDKRNDFMSTMRDALVNSGLLSPSEINSYYHRRILNYQSDEFNKSVIFGKNLGKKKRDFQKMRTGTRGMDYSTNFIETEYKVVAEGIYELEKQKILKDLMAPYEARLQSLKNEFNKQFNQEIDILENEYGKGSTEVQVKKDSKRSLMKNFLMENMPEGFVFWQPDIGNTLFWNQTISQQVIDRTVKAAQMADLDGGSAVDIVDDLISDLNMNLAVGARRKNYMVPESLAEQLEYMATTESIKPLDNIVAKITGEFKKIVLLAPNRILKYSLNNLGGDFDRMLQIEPRILKYAKESTSELWDYIQTGKATPQLLEAMRGSVIDSGFEISELSALSKQQWVGYFLDKNGPSVEDMLGKREISEMMAKNPSNLYDRYMEVARKYVGFRENILRLAAYKLATEKVQAGESFYWASRKESIDAITNPRQKIAKLSREAFGDYGNISYSGQQIRRVMMPFYSWFEINMGTHLQLMKNASTPAIQRDMIKSGLMRGIPYAAGRMAVAWSRLFLFTAAVEMWNYIGFPALPWVDDEDKDAAEKLRRANVRGMQILLYVNDDGIPVGLPIVGAFYDFVDFFGIPDVIDDIAMIFTGNSTAQRVHALKKTGSTMLSTPGGKAFNMTSPLIKMPLEYATGQTYFPDPKNPIPIRDTGEWFFNALTLKDEYNYFFTDKPQRQSYLSRKLTNSLLLREIDPELLAYYQAKRIISDYTGKKMGATIPTNPTETAKQKALYYYTLSMRYGNMSDANKHLMTYFMNGGNPKSLMSRMMGADPFKGLSKTARPGEGISEYQDLQNAIYVKNYQPFTRFVKQLTRDDILVMRDALTYQQRQQGLKSKKK